MNHKPRTRLAALLLACLLLCPSPGRSEAAVQTDVPVPQEAAIPAEETMEPQETVQEPAGNAGRGSGTRSDAYGSAGTSYTGTHAGVNRGSNGRGQRVQEVTPTQAPVLPTQEAMPEPTGASPRNSDFQRSLLHKTRPKHRPIR